MVREEELVQKAKEVRESLIEMAAREIDATHIEVGQIKAKDDTRKLLTVRVGGANRYVPYQGHDTSEFTVGDYWAIIFDDYGTIRLGWWVTNNAGEGTIPFRPHNLLDGDAHPDTVAQGVTRGSLIYGDSTPKWNELPIGAAGRVLTSDGTDVSWAAPGGVAAHNILDGVVHLDSVIQGVTRGSLIYGDSTPDWNELPIGAANRILLSDGADAGWGQADHGAALVGLLDDDHTIYFLADCTRAFGGDPIPDGADTRSLGSVDAEWLNIYIGVAGKIYFRLDQTVNLYSDIAATLRTDDDFRANAFKIMGAGGQFNALAATAAGTIRYQSSVAGDTDPRFVIYAGGLMGWGSGAAAPDTNLYRLSPSVLKTLDAFQCARVFTGNGLVDSPAHSFIDDVDIGMYRIGVNDLGFATNSTLAFELNAVQQALVTNGTVAAPGLAFIADPDTGLYRIGANRLAFATNGTLGLEIDASQVLWIGSTKDTNFYRAGPDLAKTDDSLEVGAKFTFGTPTELTIAGGVITVTKSNHIVDTEDEDPADDLVTINGGIDGMLLTLRSVASARDVTLKDGTGNLRLAGDFTLDNWHDRIFLIWDAGADAWQETSRSDNV